MHRSHCCRATGEHGIALITVVAMGAIMSILLVAAITYSISTSKSARITQDWSAAVAAAYAGVEEYQSHLAADTSYYQYGNPLAAFSASTVPALIDHVATNPAFGIGPTGPWADVAGSNGRAKFRYEVDSSKYFVDGSIKLRSTGLVDGQTRSIVSDLKQTGFISFLYFTDYEIQDPALSGDTGACLRHFWEGRPSTGCAEIAFGGGDKVKGPAHSNDRIRICDAEFTKAVTTGYHPTLTPLDGVLRYSKTNSNDSPCSGQVFSDPANPRPTEGAVLAMPASNTLLKRETRSDLTALDVPRPGCLYTGPTTITFETSGKMRVRSPWTRVTNIVGDPPVSGSTPTRCGTPGSAAGQLGGPTGQLFDVPDNNVIYVQGVPPLTSDPNSRSHAPALGPTPIGLTTSGGANGSNGLGYPRTNEETPAQATNLLPAYGATNGDVFVEGTLKGKVTIAAENYIYVVGDLGYRNVDEDILGLVGNNAVFVWNPVKITSNEPNLGNSDANNRRNNGWECRQTSSSPNRYTCTKYSSLLGGSDRKIEAAILSVKHTFQVQNYSRGGERGYLEVNGAIAQKYRGIVHSGNNGYTKKYVYDDRFKYTAPPKFLSPVNTSYGVTRWIEVDAAYDRNGNYR